MSRKVKITEKTGRFVARSPNGHAVEISIFTEFDEGLTSNCSDRTERMTYLRTEHGDNVTRLEKGRYQVVGSQIELTSDDPIAP